MALAPAPQDALDGSGDNQGAIPQPDPAAPPAPSQAPGHAIASTAASLLGHDSRSIVPFLRQNGQSLDSIHQNWCAAFTNGVLAANGIEGVRGPSKNIATSFLNWGQPAQGEPQPGDVLVLPRGRQAGAIGGHVGIATGQVADGPAGTFYLMQSGNEGGKVAYSWEPAGSVVARRAPAQGGATMAQAQTSDDPLTWFPVAKGSEGGSTRAAPAANADDPLTWFPVGKKDAAPTTTTQETPADKGGIGRNIAAGTLEGEAGVMNVLSDPYANLIARPLATAGAFLYDAGAHATGLYNPLTPEQRADLLSDDYKPQPGTRAINALGDVVGVKPSDVTATTRGEQMARAGSAGVAASPLIPGRLLAPVIGGIAAVAGEEAAKQVPDWAKPGTELGVNLLTGLAIPFGAAGVRSGGGPVGRAISAYVDAPGQGVIPGLSRKEAIQANVDRVMADVTGRTEEGGGPQPGMGGPQPVGAQASTAAQAALTPEEVANARTVAHKQWLNDPVQPGIRDPNADIPGITLNLAEQEQTVQAARELKSLKTANPELSQEEKLILDKNTRERKAFFDETIGSDITRAGDLKAANTKIETDLANVWKGKNDADPAATKAQIQTELDSSAGDLPPIQSAMKQISDSLEKAGTDPQAMYRTHRLINYLQSKVGQLANPGYGSDSVQAALTRVKATLKGDINNAAPGFDKAMSDYATARGPIDAAKALQDRENGLYDSRGHMQFLPVHKLVRDIIEAQRWDAPDHPLQFVSDEQMARLKTLHDNLKRVASAQDLAAARGSDTVQNAVDLAKGIAKAGGAVIAHGVANKVAPVAGSFVVNALGQAIERGRAARTQRRQMQRGMEMLNPPPTNPLQQGPP